jgi:hypothetical protein
MHVMLLRTLVVLQCLVVLFVALHNWIPLGSLNDRKGVRIAFPTTKLLLTTLLNLTPCAIGLAGTIVYFGHRFPGWLVWELWIFYALAVYGSLKAWWIPYLFHPDEELAVRYRTMYANTHAFLRERNGITPNTLHVAFDFITIAILSDLAVLTFQGGFGT